MLSNGCRLVSLGKKKEIQMDVTVKKKKKDCGACR